MFNNPKKNVSVNTKIETLVGASACVNGDIDANGTIKVDGQCMGNISSKTDVIVGEVGYVKGNITAANVSVSGKVEGNVTSSGLLEVLPSGRILGDIQTVNLAVSDGGVVNGNCSMTLDDIKRIIGPAAENEE